MNESVNESGAMNHSSIRPLHMRVGVGRELTPHPAVAHIPGCLVQPDPVFRERGWEEHGNKHGNCMDPEDTHA